MFSKKQSTKSATECDVKEDNTNDAHCVCLNDIPNHIVTPDATKTSIVK